MNSIAKQLIERIAAGETASAVVAEQIMREGDEVRITKGSRKGERGVITDLTKGQVTLRMSGDERLVMRSADVAVVTNEATMTGNIGGSNIPMGIGTTVIPPLVSGNETRKKVKKLQRLAKGTTSTGMLDRGNF